MLYAVVSRYKIPVKPLQRFVRSVYFLYSFITYNSLDTMSILLLSECDTDLLPCMNDPIETGVYK
jgi:hypothetical protein